MRICSYHEQKIIRCKNQAKPQRREEGDEMSRFFLPILIGGAVGAAMGYFGQCNSGACPLTATWWRGALYGATLGGLFAFSSSR
jgi:hypothetical protein